MQMNDILQRLTGVKRASGDEHYLALCPCHNDHKPSLDIKAGSKGIVMNCPVCGADGKAVMQALGLDVRELFYEQQTSQEKPPSVDYLYSDTLKKTRYYTWDSRKSRYEKAFCWYHLEGGAWIKGKGAEQPPLYKQKNIEWAKSHSQTLYIVEGEKDVDTLTKKLKLPAVCSPHGAGSGRLENKWREEYNALFSGADVAILADNDEAGRALAEHIAVEILPFAKSVKLPDLSFEWEDLKPKGDITDIYESDTPICGMTIDRSIALRLEALTVCTEGFIPPVKEEKPRPDYPEWTYDGRNGRELNEQLYITDFAERHGVKCINNLLYSVDGLFPDGRAKQLIISDILPYVERCHDKKAVSLLNGIKQYCYIDTPDPSPDKLHFKNGTLTKDENGLFTVFSPEKEFCLNRFAADYDPNAPKPERFLKYLSEVYHEDDRVTLQQYCGYCLLPSTVLQKMLIILGSGGEGKSVLGAILNGVIGETNCFNESINTLQSRFGVANIENKLLFIDDDLSENAIHSARNLKTLVTNKGIISAERKGIQDNQIKAYARFLCFGNFPIQALYDTSEGFTRRQLILEAKPKAPDRTDNPYLDREILKNEAEGVLLWLLEGLNTLIQNNLVIAVSERTQTVSDNIKRENDTVALFLDECPDLEIKPGLTVFSETLKLMYDDFCTDNVLPALKPKSFIAAVKSKGKSKGISYSTNVTINGRRSRGFEGIGSKK